jgi:hypothetical protein
MGWGDYKKSERGESGIISGERIRQRNVVAEPRQSLS